MKKSIPSFSLLFAGIFLSQQYLSAQDVLTGKSYVNITKGVNGGTIEPGDILEIRATIAVGNSATITRARYNDTIPANTTYVAGSLKILTNEGLVYKAYTDVANDDAAMFDNTNKTLRINMGSYGKGVMGGVCTNTGIAITGGGTIAYNGRPSFYQSTAIMSASYRIQINTALAYGSTIYMYGGAFRFNDGVDQVRLLPYYTIALRQNLGLCSNSIGANAVIDNGGTFGSGTTQNRTTSAIVPGYTFATIGDNSPNDGSYAIINNLSPAGSTIVNSAIPYSASPQRRVFGIWDIMGDHTGAAVPANGNAPVAPGTAGGYFVAINASFANNNAIQQTIGGLCPNTYYEFSAWFKNVCKYCACDSTADAPYKNGTPNSLFNGPDSSGVNPNLTFTIDGVDYYTSGNLKYTGQWVKKGFVYLTGPTQTSFTITIRNNAAGGGGNDWAIDDVTLATCTPNLTMQPSPTAQVCYGNQINISALIRCFFPNYTFWRWEKSTNGGATWTNTGVSGTGSPVLVAGEYQYTATYPSFLGDSTNHNNIFRIRLASSAANLNNNSCSFLATTTVVVMVNNCSDVLSTKLIFFAGTTNNNYATLQWNTSNETELTTYEIESSDDQVHFVKVGVVQGSIPNQGSNTYSFKDAKMLAQPRYYRIKMVTDKGYVYSKIILLGYTSSELAIRMLNNPFVDHIGFELSSPQDGNIQLSVMDAYGRVVRQQLENGKAGLNTIHIGGLTRLPAGMYLLRIQQGDKTVVKRMIKAEQ